ncbi:MAG: hypothetical protein OEL83_12275 [Desulforhopalus sp.]|nr:hypothetical protein [Desulforhopalus sp.]
MISGHQVYTVGLFGRNVEIEYNCKEAGDFINFLFQDLPPGDGPTAKRRFELIFVGKPVRMSLWEGEKKIYFGESAHTLAYILANEILHECIVDNNIDQAIHAAAVLWGGKSILLPGKSGSGKSSLAAWLALQGCTYLTDELVLLTQDGLIGAFTRPISLRRATIKALSGGTIGLDLSKCIAGAEGAMVPHRLLNPRWSAATPQLSCIIFPEFINNQPPVLTRLSKAQGCMQLLGCYVNARNFSGHGFSELAENCRNVVSYELKFGSFAGLREVLDPVFGGE